MHKCHTEWMREESKKNREMLQILMTKVEIEPVALLQPAVESSPLMLKGQLSGSNISNASRPLEIANVPPPLPAKAPILVPLPPSEQASVAVEPKVVNVEEREVAMEDIKVFGCCRHSFVK